jgi:hypothetical protein
MANRKTRDPKKSQIWKEHIENYRSSGLSQIDFCSRHGLKLSTLGYWITYFNRQQQSKDFVEVAVKPVQATGIELRIKEQIVISVTWESDLSLLKKVLNELDIVL